MTSSTGAEARRAALLDRCTFPPAGAEAVAAVSGGPDSLAMLVLARQAGCRVTAVHVDHGLRPGSAAEAEVVREAAEAVGAAFRSERALVEPGPNLEARARAARREVLGERAMTGHTADDQAETVLLNLLRGAGLDGLAGMRAGPAKPILALRRQETAAVCADLGLAVVDDPSNRDPAIRRNRIRHEVVPLLIDVAQRDVVPLLARTAALAAEDAALLDRAAQEVDPTDCRALSTLDPALARRALRRWLVLDEPPYPPDFAALERVLNVATGVSRAVELPGGRRVTRTGGRLRIDRDAPAGS